MMQSRRTKITYRTVVVTSVLVNIALFAWIVHSRAGFWTLPPSHLRDDPAVSQPESASAEGKSGNSPAEFGAFQEQGKLINGASTTQELAVPPKPNSTGAPLDLRDMPATAFIESGAAISEDVGPSISTPKRLNRKPSKILMPLVF